MKLVSKLSLIAALAASPSAFAQSNTMQGMDMKDKPMNDCMASTLGPCFPELTKES